MILIVDDVSAAAEAIADILMDEGYATCWSNAPLDALQQFVQNPEKFDLVILDDTMPYMTGVELCLEFAKHSSTFEVILMPTLVSSVEKLANRFGRPFQVLNKPFTFEELFLAVENVVGKRK